MPRTRKQRGADKAQAIQGDDPEQGDIEVGIQQNALAPTVAKLQDDLKLLKEENRILKEENRLLKDQRDFLKEKLHNEEKISSSRVSKGSKKRVLMDSSDSSDSSDSLSDSESDSFTKSGKSKKKKIKKKTTSFGKRVKNPEDVVHRYRTVLKEFKRTRSMTVSCKRLDVDRNTIALTAIIAEVLIASEGESLGPLPAFTDEDTISTFAKTCKDFLEENQCLREKIKQMKKDSELLPIKYKFRK